MLDRHNLGNLISAEKTSKGVGNQTLFIHSSKGSYVLKGNPLYAGQFAEEKFYTDYLQEHTSLPCPSHICWMSLVIFSAGATRSCPVFMAYI